MVDWYYLVNYVKRGDLEGTKKCISLGADINQKDDIWGQTFVMWAAEHNSLEILQYLIHEGADIHIPDEGGKTPLFYAAYRGHSEALQILLSAGADINLRAKTGETPLHAAAASGSEETLSILIKHMTAGDLSIDPVDNDGETPLFYATRNVFPEGVRQLCHAGSQVNDVNPRRKPLIAAARSGDKTTAEILLGQGADPNLPDEDGRLPIYWAAKAGNLELFQLFPTNLAAAELDEPAQPLMPLLEAMKESGKDLTLADTQLEDYDSWTALHLAANIGHSAAVRVLIKAGSNVNAITDGGMSPLLLAARNGNVPSIEALLSNNEVDANFKDTVYGRTALSWAAGANKTEAVDLLAKTGNDINSLDGSGLTPLMLAAKDGHCDIIKALFNSKAVNMDIKDTSHQQTALSWAATDGQAEAVDLLAKFGSDVNSLCRYGRTPLIFAARNGHCDAIKALLKNKALDLHFKDTLYERTALSWAVENGQAKAADLLATAGSDINSLDKCGRTPLMLAARYGSSDLIKTLLKFGPELDVRDTTYDQSAVAFATEDGYAEIVELLIEAHCNIYSQEEQYPPLNRAAERGDPEILRLFFEPKSVGESLPGKSLRVKAIEEALRHSFNRDYPETKEFILSEEKYMTCTDENGRTLLSWAAEGGNEEIVGALLDSGAEPNTSDNNGRTPLSWAAGSGNLAVAKKLLSRMETSGPRTEEGELAVELKAEDTSWTPLWYAADGGHVNVVNALLEAGANPLALDKGGKNIMQYLATGETPPAFDTSTVKAIGRNDVWEVLEPFFSLSLQDLAGVEEIDKPFSAIVL